MIKAKHMPTNWFKIEKNGSTKGVQPWTVKLLKSNVGKGLTPRPATEPQMLLSVTLVGAIQLIQLK